jgi:hypothetical protein
MSEHGGVQQDDVDVVVKLFATSHCKR